MKRVALQIETSEKEHVLDVTSKVQEIISAEFGEKSGFVFMFCPHTTAAVSVNESDDPDVRLKIHNSHGFKGSSTAIASDWELFMILSCRSRSVARRIEKHIKSMKSTTYIRNLKKYPEMVEKLVVRYNI